ncbi:MAG: hypothetical protein SCK29_03650 [Bacillota bacterium]|nr:hypothetical protein [Bacillota bacterium]
MAIALLSPVLAVVAAFSPLGSRSWERNAGLAEAQQHARIALEELAFELKNAYYVEADQARQVITYRKKIDGEFKTYQVYLSGRQLLLNLPEGTAVPLASCIDALHMDPGGVLRGGETVTITVYASSQEHNVALSSGVLPKNNGEGLR